MVAKWLGRNDIFDKVYVYVESVRKCTYLRTTLTADSLLMTKWFSIIIKHVPVEKTNITAWPAKLILQTTLLALLHLYTLIATENDTLKIKHRKEIVLIMTQQVKIPISEKSIQTHTHTHTL